MRAFRFLLPAAILLLAACSAVSPAAQETTTRPAPTAVVVTPAPTGTAVPSATPAPTETATPELPATPTRLPPTEEPAAEPTAGVDVVAAYAGASYRPIAVVKNPFAPYTVIIVAERAPLTCGSQEAPQRCWADDLCGSTYTSKVCYFFVEPSFDAAADPRTRFIAQWPEFPGVNALQPGTIRFVDADTLEFVAPGGDGGYSVEETWQLNLTDGALTLVSRVEQSVDTP